MSLLCRARMFRLITNCSAVSFDNPRTRRYWATVPPQRSVNYRDLSLLLHQNNGAQDEGHLENRARRNLRCVGEAATRAQRDKIEDKMVADLEAILANMKRGREQVERGRNEIRRTA